MQQRSNHKKMVKAASQVPVYILIYIYLYMSIDWTSTIWCSHTAANFNKKKKKNSYVKQMQTNVLFLAQIWIQNGLGLQLASRSFYIHFSVPCFLVVAGPSGSSEGVATSTKPSTKRTIQEMEGKSEAFKSLFTTHSSAKRTKDQTSNWVTHTPYHF